MRLFAAIQPPPEALHDLEATVRDVRDGHLRWTDVDAWHLTLAFYGEVDEASVPELTTRLERAASRTAAMELQLASAGRFGHHVLWVGVHGDTDRLQRLAASAAAAGRRIGLDRTGTRPYRPHVTLARSPQRHDLRPYVSALSTYGGPWWHASSMLLVRSHLRGAPSGRARYETLADFPLAPQHLRP